MLTFAQQRQVLALAVHIDQQTADLAQQRGGHRPAVDARHRPAVGAHFAGQHEEIGVIAFQAVLGQQRHDPGRRRPKLERALDFGALRAGAHHIGRRAIPEQEVDGVDDDGLARAGFAGEHIEARRENQIEPIDDGQVADTEFS